MKQAHVLAITAVFTIICTVAYATAEAQGVAMSALVSELSQSVVWLIAGGVAVLCALGELRVAKAKL